MEISRSRNVPRTSRRHVSSERVASLRYAGPVVDELKQLIYHSGSLLLVGSTQVALVDHPKWYVVSAAPLSAAYKVPMIGTGVPGRAGKYAIVITRCERVFRSGRTRPAHAQSSGSERWLRIQSLVAYIIGTLESRSRKRQVTGYSEARSSGLRRAGQETLSTGGDVGRSIS